ncbi:MAG: hypothetical protein BMS9Abin36_0664 [Gammaproteobacteria bacterium]|nr:MAG: hypothetical protein BMS9Abin36_0664 [Gammaproteobacteria bacterium]
MPVSISSLYLNQHTSVPELLVCGKGHAAVYTRPSPEHENSNQDGAAILCTDTSALLAITDGVGGLPAGDQAAALALTSLKDSYLSQPLMSPEQSRSAILNGIEAANEAVLELGTGAATTLAAINIQDQQLRTYHIGDSMILVVGQRGKIKLQTVPHSPVGYAVESGMLDEDEALHHKERHLVSNVIGTTDMRIEIGSPITLAQKDTVLVASDGLFDNLELIEIINIIRCGILDHVARQLSELAYQRMTQSHEDKPSKPDDLSFILYRR